MAMGRSSGPRKNGYITRSTPNWIYTNGTVPRVPLMLDLHHAVWGVNGSAAVRCGGGEDDPANANRIGWLEPTPVIPSFSTTCCTTSSPSRPRSTSFGEWTSFLSARPTPPPYRPVHTRWLDVAGEPEPSTRSSMTRDRDGHNGTLHVPRSGAGGGPPSLRAGRAASRKPRLSRSRAELDPEPKRDPDCHRRTPAPGRPRHAAARHPRVASTNTLFTSDAHYYEPAGEVSWDVAMGGDAG